MTPIKNFGLIESLRKKLRKINIKLQSYENLIIFILWKMENKQIKF